MTIIYEVIAADELTPEIRIKSTNSNGDVWIIPTDPNNSDYAAYLATLG